MHCVIFKKEYCVVKIATAEVKRKATYTFFVCIFILLSLFLTAHYFLVEKPQGFQYHFTTFSGSISSSYIFFTLSSMTGMKAKS
jgi:hypothetical protein